MCSKRHVVVPVREGSAVRMNGVFPTLARACLACHSIIQAQPKPRHLDSASVSRVTLRSVHHLSSLSGHQRDKMQMYKEASNRTMDVLKTPLQYARMYPDFVIKNASAINQVETALRSLTYIIPGRFRDSEIASESCKRIWSLPSAAATDVRQCILACSSSRSTMTLSSQKQ